MASLSPQFTPDRPAEISIEVATGHSLLRLLVGAEGRLFQLGYGSRETTRPPPPATAPAREDEFYPQSGNGFIFEPALQVFHADGNTSTDLIYVRHETSAPAEGISLTRIDLKDRFYPFFVTLFLQAFWEEDVIEQWAEIFHEEPETATLFRFASSSPLITAAAQYWLTHFHGDWANEGGWCEEKLTSGIKILDSKVGVRAHQFRTPAFVLSLGQEAREEEGEVYGGTLAWSGNFQFAFEIDVRERLRILSGINPFGATYRLSRGDRFVTPSHLWTWSARGKGQVSRNFHRWAQNHCLRDGARPRPVLLNNWEATGFNFDECRLVKLLDGAQELGAEVFLLDDGWFGERYPRDNDRAGLGDWQVNARKLPRGLGYLAKEANRRGLRFGLWLEPEMINPASDLFERHPEWAVGQAHRAPILGRNQRVLDLARPEVKEFVWSVLDTILRASPEIEYIKWDCNCFVTQPGSTWLPAGEQAHLLIHYQWALYEVMARLAAQHPRVTAMLCSGGGGRVDYGALRYFHSFWPSDNTDPLRRVFIQWAFSHFFPANTLCAHVTRMGARPLKFALDVAMSGALGFDLAVEKMTPDELLFAAEAVALYRTRLRPLVQTGNLFRIESPYGGSRAALAYVSEDRRQAVLFVYQIGAVETVRPVKLRGLDPELRYAIAEVNLAPSIFSTWPEHGQILGGARLMAEGMTPACRKALESGLIELTAVEAS